MAFARLKRVPGGLDSSGGQDSRQRKEVPAERYLSAWLHLTAMPRHSLARNRFLPSLQEIEQHRAAGGSTDPGGDGGVGPDAAAGLAGWTPLGPGNVGGRTRSLVIDPLNTHVMYAAGVAGGVWKTTDGGASWRPMSDVLSNLAIATLAMDPKNHEVIYAGTGEGFTNADAVRGAGIFRTEDGGASWQFLDATATAAFHYINDIIVSPNDSMHLYAATREGVFRSLDRGTSWTQELEPPAYFGCLDLAARTDTATDTVFASCGEIFTDSVVYRNTDAAGPGVWENVLTEPGMDRTTLAIALSNQDIIYAAAAGAQGVMFAVYRSIDGGSTWHFQVRGNDSYPLNRLLFTNSFQALCNNQSGSVSSQGWYDNAVAVDPLDPETVWIGGIDLFRSSDGGRNWGLGSYWWLPTHAGPYVHADQHAIVFDPNYDGVTNRRMFVANDGGVFRTDDATAKVSYELFAPCSPGQNFMRWQSLDNGYGVTQFYHGLPYPGGAQYFGGTQDNGTIHGSDETGPDAWDQIVDGDGGFVAIDPADPRVLYAENGGPTIRKSLDGGKSFQSANGGIADSTLFITPFTMDPNDSQTLWLGGTRLWRTVNGAAFWNQASAHLGVVSAIAVAPSDSNIVAVGTAAGFVHRTDKGLISGGSTTWPGVRVVPNGAFISSIVFDSYDPDVMYVTSSSFKSSPDESHVYRSVDSGLTWVGIDGTGDTALPDIPVHVIVVDPIHTERLFIGTDAGVFVSSDGGATWAVEETGFPNVSTESLAINTYCSEPTLFAFTHGRGAWKVPIEGDCHYELSSAGATVPDLGDTGELTITTSAGCGWSAVSESDWITLESGGCGEANGTVRFTVARNLLATPRTGTIRIAGNVFTVEQAERPCVLSLSSPSSTHGAKAAPGSFAISVGAACEWSAVSNAPWIVVTSATAGRGPASLTYAIAANEGPPRIGTIRADDQVFTIRQAQPSPTVQSASPGQGCPGQPVVITGSHFLGATGVYFNGIPSTSFTVMSDTNISAIVPEGDISGPVTVATPGGFSAGEGVFEVNPGPTILDITPPVGIEGLEVTIHGRNLKGVTAVRFEGAPPVAVHARSASTIKVTVPKGIRNGPLGLEAAGACREVQSSFPFYAYPFIRSVSARGGHWGTLMSMSGVNLGGATAVTFRGLPATFVVLADEVILVIIPVGARRGAIQVHTPGGIAVSPIFTAYP